MRPSSGTSRSSAQPPWWSRAVVYQVYPRSFQDGDGDGVGDLRGIRRRLPYLGELGVDAVWISPIFPSPMADFGYDISDYTGIDLLFGYPGGAIMPAVAITALFSFMQSWNEFILAATLIDKENMYTAPVGLGFFVAGFSQQWGYFAAGAIIVGASAALGYGVLKDHQPVFPLSSKAALLADALGTTVTARIPLSA